MKAKRKIDKKAIKQFFIDHTEKIVIGVVGLVFLYFTYSAVMLQVNESYKKAPSDLIQATKTANDTMQRGPSKTPASETPIPDYAVQIEEFKKPIPPEEGVWLKDIVKNILAPPRVRGTPDVIAVEELRAVAGRGALVNQGGNVATAGQRWVAITGLVPYHKQALEYRRCFADAADDSNMEPIYYGFLVQRAEVPAASGGTLNWDKSMTVCTQDTLPAQVGKWSGVSPGVSPEVVEQRFTWPSLTSPLPPLGVGEWGDEAAHAPTIKLLPREERDQAAGVGNQQNPGGLVPPGLHNSRNPRDRFVPSRPGFGPGGLGLNRDPNRRMGGRPDMRGGTGGMGRLPGAGLNGGPRMPGAVPGLRSPNTQGLTDADKNKAAEETPDYLLLRYFDFDVEPGKQYVYRVVPLLENPNYGLPQNVLDRAEESEQPLLHCKVGKDELDANFKVADWQIDDTHCWSQPFQSSRVPGDLRLIAGAVEPPKMPSPAEATAEVRVLKWSDDSGLNLSYGTTGQFRGSVLNYPDVEMKPLGDPNRIPIPHLDTNCVLVDIAGGEPLSARDKDKIRSPGMFLVLDDAGNLVIHDEMGETKEWVAATKEPEQPVNNFRPRGRTRESQRRPPDNRGQDSSLPDGGFRRLPLKRGP